LELKISINEIKSTMQSFHNRLEATEEIISEFENWSFELTQSDKKKKKEKKRMKKVYKTYGMLLTSICIVGIPEGEEKGKACIKNLYHEIVTKNV
jgi:hypothetical protein